MSDKTVDKRQKNILFWVLTWAALLLVVLYSPLGSPDLYNPKQFYIGNQGVAFNGGSVATYGAKPISMNNVDIKNNNPRKYSAGGSYGSADNSLAVSNTNNPAKRMTITNASSTSKNAAANVTMNFPTITNNQSGSSSPLGMGGEFYSNGGKNSKKTNTDQVPGLTSLSTNLTMFPSITNDNSTTKQTGTTGLAGTTDPGGDPEGDPIPVGEGWIFLLCLAATYGIFKLKINRS